MDKETKPGIWEKSRWNQSVAVYWIIEWCFSLLSWYDHFYEIIFIKDTASPAERCDLVAVKKISSFFAFAQGKKSS